MKELVLSLIVVCSAVMSVILLNKSTEPTEWTEYIVCDGDTICDISQSITSNNQDYRETEYYIIKKNKIENAMIYSGQTILIPVYK